MYHVPVSHHVQYGMPVVQVYGTPCETVGVHILCELLRSLLVEGIDGQQRLLRMSKISTGQKSSQSQGFPCMIAL
jgi:hypothetical protein